MNNQFNSSIEKMREDLTRMQNRIRELEQQLADMANGQLPEESRLEPDMIQTSSMVASQTGEPVVVLRWFTHVAQLPVAQARELALSLLDAAEAAKSDAFLVGFMAPSGPEAGAQLVAAFREYRQMEGRKNAG